MIIFLEFGVFSEILPAENLFTNTIWQMIPVFELQTLKSYFAGMLVKDPFDF